MIGGTVANHPIGDLSERSKDLLLAEHEHFADSFWRNEEAGEKRVTFFITLVTAVLAAIVALATKQGSLTEGQIGGIAFAACLSLLAVGILTFRRLIHRNGVTDEYKVAMAQIRSRFIACDPRGLAGYDPFPKRTGGARSFGRGGLTDLVAVVDSIIVAAAIAALVASSGSVVAIVAVPTFGFVLALIAHAAYLEHRYHGTWVHPLWRRLLARGSTPREVESSLVVLSETPEAVLQAIEGLGEVAGHPLGAARSEQIVDRYFDTVDLALAKRKFALRVRDLDGRVVVTLKGPSATGRWGSEDRLELECDWSEEAWRRVLAVLGQHGVVVGPAPTSPLGPPLETLGAAGLETVQHREALRRIRSVLPRGSGQGRVAELALDTVTFHISGRDLRHYEVEIEAKARGGESAVAAVTTELVDRYWPWLRPWRHGKLPTGKAVTALLDEGQADDLVGRDGTLKPHAYDAIAASLEGGQ